MTGTARRGLAERLTAPVRLVAGAVFLVNGLNWWVKLITPYPSRSDFVDFLPPPDVVGAMIENGVLFNLVKLAEVAIGIALLANRFVPVALVAALPVTLPIFIMDVFFIAHLRGQVMGWGTLILNMFLLAACLGHYHPLLNPVMDASAEARRAGVSDESALARWLAKIAEPIMPAFALLALAAGLAMLAWLAVMVVQYAADPQPLSALFPLEPRT